MKLAAERRRVAKAKAREAREREREAQRRSRLGPLEVVGPDGAVVGLAVLPSGEWGVTFSGGSGDWLDVPIWFAIVLANLFGHWVLFRVGSTVHLRPAGREPTKIRMRPTRPR